MLIRKDYFNNSLFFTFKISSSKIGIGDTMQRYFVSKNNKNQFILSESDTYHITKVMRMNLGDQIEIVYNNTTYICEITCLTPYVEAFIIKEVLERNELNCMVTIVQSLVKEQKMDYILQKTTELGVFRIIPYQAERSLIKLGQKQDKKIERWQNIVKEAAEQSKRNQIPIVERPINLSELVNLKDYDIKFLCTVNETSQNIKKLLSKLSRSVRILFVIGPEGGFTEKEESMLLKNGFVPLSLGSSVLRTETASTFIMSVIRYIDME